MMKIIGNLLKIHVMIFATFFVINLFMMDDPYTHFDFSTIVKGVKKVRLNKIVDAMYITSTTHTSTGYGDISPKSTRAKILAVLHQGCVFIFTAGILRN